MNIQCKETSFCECVFVKDTPFTRRAVFMDVLFTRHSFV